MIFFWLATVSHAEEVLRSPAPLEVTVSSVDTVGLGINSTVLISASCWPKQITNVTARIVPDSGFEVVSQPQETYGLPDTAAVTFKGIIRATSRGIWEVKVEAAGGWGDNPRATSHTSFYIQVSDSVCRALTDLEYQRTVPTLLKLPQPPKNPVLVPQKHSGKRALPNIPDSLQHKTGGQGRRAGTFDITGILLYHDARDAEGWFREAVNCDVEIWNDNEYDNPPGADTWLGTTTTDWYGCFTMNWLDNSDEDGTADPYLVFVTENSSWSVKQTPTSSPYKWFSQITRDVTDNSVVDFGTHYIYGGEPYNEGAMWCFQYMNLGWEVAEEVGPHPEFVQCIWPATATETGIATGTINIMRDHACSIDIVNHEYGHAMMVHAYSHVLPGGCNEQPINVGSCEGVAWREGWANFFALVVTPDGQMDYDLNGFHFDVEYHQSSNFAQGPAVSGRVAGALLDLWDTDNDGEDENSDYPVSFETVYTWGIQSHRDSTFHEFWNYIRDNELTYTQSYRGTRSIKNNTINGFAGKMKADCDASNSIDISDAVYLVDYIFNGGPAPFPYELVGDANSDDSVDISDLAFLIQYFFAGGATPGRFE